MADQDDKQLSRRARRRAEKEHDDSDDSGVTAAESDANESEGEAETEAEGEGEGDTSAESAAEPDAAASTDEDAGASDDDAKSEASPASDKPRKPRRTARAESPDRPKKPSKSERKRAKQEERSATASIRDRNKRLREQAVQRRRGKRDAERPASGLDAGEMVDDALARATHTTTEFLRRHFTAIQWVVVIAIAGGIGWEIYSWRSHKTNAAASDELIAGVDDEFGRVGPEPTNPDEVQASVRPDFDTDEARLAAAQKAYTEAEAKHPGSGTSILGTLGKAGVLYDEGKYDEAKAAYEQVRASALAQHDADVRLRSVEGVGLCLEAKGDADGALKSFAELEKADEAGFSALGLFHQARVLYNKGDKDKAKELIAKVQDKLSKESPLTPATYLERASRDLLAMIDPSTAPPPSQGSYSPQQLDELKAQILKDPTKLKKMLEDMGKMKAPTLPLPEGPQEPTPEAPAPGPSGSP